MAKKKRPSHPRSKKYKSNGAEPPANGKTGPSGTDPAPLVLADGVGAVEERADARMVSRAVTERWPTDPEYRRALRQRVQIRALETTSDASLAALARVDVAMEAQNQADSMHSPGGDRPAQITIINQIRAELDEIRRDPSIMDAVYAQITENQPADGDGDVAGSNGG